MRHGRAKLRPRLRARSRPKAASLALDHELPFERVGFFLEGPCRAVVLPFLLPLDVPPNSAAQSRGGSSSSSQAKGQASRRVWAVSSKPVAISIAFDRSLYARLKPFVISKYEAPQSLASNTRKYIGHISFCL